MAPTLYRKYRPQRFGQVVGQNHIKVTLQNELVADRFAHAYLFTGPRGVGKTTLARILAKALNCLQPGADGEPDGTCAACQELQRGQSLDLIEIDAASHTGVENVRSQIIENARFSPTRWKYKVFIIDEVHMLSLSAFNALLKTLEEPPAHALFILATTEVHKVPETIVSRCQRFDFRPLPKEDIIERLRTVVEQEGMQVEDDVFALIARHARGSLRDAESALGQILTLSEGTITREQAALVLPRTNAVAVQALFGALVRRDATESIRIVNEVTAGGVALPQFVQDMQECIRTGLLQKVASQLDIFSTLTFDKDEEEQFAARVQEATQEQLEKMLRVFLDLDMTLRQSMLPQLPIELAVLGLTVTGADMVPPSAMARPLPQQPAQRPPARSPADPAAEQTTPAADPAAPPPTPASQASASASDLSLETVSARWQDVLAALQKKNQSLRLTCNVAVPLAVQENTVTLGVGYEFHRERIDDVRNRVIIESVLSEVFSMPVLVRAVVNEAVPKRISYEREANVEPIVPTADLAAVAAAATPALGAVPVGDNTWDALIEAFGGGKSAV